HHNSRRVMRRMDNHSNHSSMVDLRVDIRINNEGNMWINKRMEDNIRTSSREDNNRWIMVDMHLDHNSRVMCREWEIRCNLEGASRWMMEINTNQLEVTFPTLRRKIMEPVNLAAEEEEGE